MEGFVAHTLNEFEQGKINRRKLIETLTFAATTAYATGSAGAAEGLKSALVNHISYTCPNFRQAADWYSKVFNLDQIGARDKDVALPFGKKGDQPYNVAAKDVPLTHLIIRTRGASDARPCFPIDREIGIHRQDCVTFMDFGQAHDTGIGERY